MVLTVACPGNFVSSSYRCGSVNGSICKRTQQAATDGPRHQLRWSIQIEYVAEGFEWMEWWDLLDDQFAFSREEYVFVSYNFVGRMRYKGKSAFTSTTVSKETRHSRKEVVASQSVDQFSFRFRASSLFKQSVNQKQSKLSLLSTVTIGKQISFGQIGMADEIETVPQDISPLTRRGSDCEIDYSVARKTPQIFAALAGNYGSIYYLIKYRLNFIFTSKPRLALSPWALRWAGRRPFSRNCSKIPLWIGWRTGIVCGIFPWMTIKSRGSVLWSTSELRSEPFAEVS